MGRHDGSERVAIERAFCEKRPRDRLNDGGVPRDEVGGGAHGGPKVGAGRVARQRRPRHIEIDGAGEHSGERAPGDGRLD
jgi:hypothetical protein